MIVNRLGADSNGLYQVSLAVSRRYLGIILVALWSYGLPKVTSMLGDPDGIAKVLNDALRLLLLALTPLIVFILMFRSFWIPLLYSPDFLGAYSLITWQVIGDVCRALGWPVGLTILPKERFGFFVGSTLMFSVIQLGSFSLFLPAVGLPAASIAYALGNAFVLLLNLIGIYLYDCFYYSSRNWGLIAKSTLVLGLTLVLTSSPNAKPVLNYLLPIVALGVWGLTSIDRREAQMAIEMIRGYASRFGKLLRTLTKQKTGRS